MEWNLSRASLIQQLWYRWAGWRSLKSQGAALVWRRAGGQTKGITLGLPQRKRPTASHLEIRNEHSQYQPWIYFNGIHTWLKAQCRIDSQCPSHQGTCQQSPPRNSRPELHLSDTLGLIWRFPEIRVPPDHPFIDGFSIINHPFWGTSVCGKPHIRHVCSWKSSTNWLHFTTLRSSGHGQRSHDQGASDGYLDLTGTLRSDHKIHLNPTSKMDEKSSAKGPTSKRQGPSGVRIPQPAKFFWRVFGMWRAWWSVDLGMIWSLWLWNPSKLWCSHQNWWDGAMLLAHTEKSVLTHLQKLTNEVSLMRQTPSWVCIISWHWV